MVVIVASSMLKVNPVCVLFQLVEANNEISVLKDQCSAYRENISQLKTDLEEYDQLSYRSKTVRCNHYYKLSTGLPKNVLSPSESLNSSIVAFWDITK